MSDLERIPSVDHIKALHRHIQEILSIAQTVPPARQSTLDKGVLTGAIYGMEFIATAEPHYVAATPPTKGGASRVKGWTPGLSNVLDHVRRVATTVLTRWKLTRAAEWKPFPDRDPLPDFPLVVEDDELQLLAGAGELIGRALNAMVASPAPIRGDAERVERSEGDLAGNTDDFDWIRAVPCSQTDVSTFFGGKGRPRGGTLAKLKESGEVLDFHKKGSKFWVIFRRPGDEEAFRQFIEKRKLEDKRETRGEARQSAAKRGRSSFIC